ncbi:hypothetical protein ACFYZ2_40615 [Streptomyces sviceus]|uniref:hypothetical protein n=1 Tax=Streptomyces sviceus TaxID=285530 RepID=UPI003692DC6D
MDCRAFLTAGADAAVTLLPALSGADNRMPVRIGTRNVRAVRQAARPPGRQAASRIYDHGSPALRQKASQILHHAYGWLQDGQLTDRTERQLRSGTGHLSIAVGW